MNATAWFTRQRETITSDPRRLIVIALVIALLASLVVALRDAGWLVAGNDQVLWAVVSWGALWGLLLAWRVRRTILTILFTLISGLFFVIQSYSLALPPVRPALQELRTGAGWLVAWINAALYRLLNPAVTVILPVPPTHPQWRAAAERLWQYGYNLAAQWPPTWREPAAWQNQQILLGSFWSILLWCAAALLVWALIRKKAAWIAVTPPLALLLFNVYHNPSGWGTLTIAAGTALLIIAELNLRALEHDWQDSFPDFLALDWWLWAGVLAVLAAGAMTLAARLTDPEFRQWVDDLLHPQNAQTVFNEDLPTGNSSTDRDRPGVWPRQHLLNTGPDLSDTPVMTVHTPDVAPARFYWRYGSYDEYTGRGWVRNTAEEPLETLWPESPIPPEHMLLLRQDIIRENSAPYIYAAGRPVWLSQPAQGRWLDDSTNDLIAVQTTSPVVAYQALSWLPTVGAEDLRTAGTDYPQWITDHYLSLPEDIPQRVSDLALELTTDADTPYDQALALQTYLRTYEYNLDLPVPPTDRDIVDYFLFDLGQGYCDYYASSMVVMARAAGIPARMAVGYASGEFNTEYNLYHVTLADSHSWVEVYFPAYGWITFEPTAARPAPDFALPEVAAAAVDTLSAEEVLAQVESDPAALRSSRTYWPVLAILAVLLVTVSAIPLYNLRRLHRLRSGAAPLSTRLYNELIGHARKLDVNVSPDLTPYELRDDLFSRLAELTTEPPRWGGDWAKRRIFLEAALNKLISLYTADQYTAHKAAQTELDTLLANWPPHDRALHMFRLLQRLKRAS